MHHRLPILLNAYLSGTLTPDQHRELISLLENEAFTDELGLLIEASAGETIPGDELPATEQRIIHGLLQKIQSAQSATTETPNPSTPIRRLTRRWAWAAAILLIASTGAYLWHLNIEKPPIATTRPASTDIAPGGNKATLTLADGRTITLDSTTNGAIAQQGNTTVVKSADGQLAYRPQSSTSSGSPTTPANPVALLNTLRTPRGGGYHLTLPDGTGVWLNSASAITYPTVFTGNNRKVTISGEAYFEAAKQKDKPFLVDVDGRSSIEVLGTSFNVNSYTDEPAITTTLLEGAVRVSDFAAAHRTVTLKPGEQAHAATSGLTIVHHADLDKVMAWKNGLFNFENAYLGEVMRQVQRWYDVQVIYPKGIPNIQFEGEMSRNINLSDLLKALARADVRFRLEEGRRLVVLP